ncbi:hypothetical protein RhiJN_07422 [Ceratobasidium sp. AG-Ba]|nr:hypothetical protein RhiJN_07422 [Ceratobasidium sp. AG-Ba]
MPVAPLAIPTEQVHAYAQYGRKNSRARRQVPHALALKTEPCASSYTGNSYSGNSYTGANNGKSSSPRGMPPPHHSRRRSSVAPPPANDSPQTYSFLPLPGEGWTISPTSSLSASPPAPVSLFASPALSPAVYSRRPSSARRRPSRADGDVSRPSIDSGRLQFPLPPSSPPRSVSVPKPQQRRTSMPAPAFQHPLGPADPPPTAHHRFFEPVSISRASLAQVAQPPLPVRSTTIDSVNETQMYDELKTFVFGAASTSHDVDMDDAASDAASAYNPLSPPIRPDGSFAAGPARRASAAGLKNARRASRAGLREASSSNAAGKRRNSRAWIPSDPAVAKPEIAVTSVPRDQDVQDAIDDEDEHARVVERAKMRALDDGARRPSLPINIPDSGRRGSRDTDRIRVAPAGSPMEWAKPLPDAPRRPSGTLATAGFDLDFILAAPASYPPANTSGQGVTQTGGTAMSWDSYQQGRRDSTQFGIHAPSFAPPVPPPATHEAQAIDVEDTFLSMVRQLDSEYGRRRNKWSFRQEPRRAYDYDLDPDEEVWGCEPVGTFWVGRDRSVPAGTDGPVPVVIKPLLPQISPKTQAPPPERRSDIRIHRDEKRPLFKLSLLPAGSRSTVPVKILLATKAMHLKVASAPIRPEGRRRGHTINGETGFEMASLSSNSDHTGLGRIDEMVQHPKTSHAVAFDMLTDAELDHAGRRHVSFGERLRRAFGSESPPPPMVTPPPSFSPPWLMMAPQSAKEEQLKQIRELHTAFRAVGLLTPPKPNGKDVPGQAHAIKAVRMPHETHADKTATEILDDIPADALCMILPLWQFRASVPQTDGFAAYPLASVDRPTNEREYLLVYFVPLGAQTPGVPAGPNARLSKKRSRGNMGHRTASSSNVSSSSAAAAASWAKGRRTAFHVVARILTATELCASGLRHPGTFVQPDMSASTHRPRSDAGSRAFPTVIAMCNGTGTSVEFVPEGLDRLELCQPSYEWQNEAERFPGLTPVGVEVVEMVWAGCVAVLGIGC